MVSTSEVLTRSTVHPEDDARRVPTQLALSIDLGPAVSHDVDFDSSDALRVGAVTEKSARSTPPNGVGKTLTPAQQARGAQASLLWGESMAACRLSSGALGAALGKGEQYVRALANPHLPQAWTGRDLLAIGEHYPAFQAELGDRLRTLAGDAAPRRSRTLEEQMFEVHYRDGLLSRAIAGRDPAEIKKALSASKEALGELCAIAKTAQ